LTHAERISFFWRNGLKNGDFFTKKVYEKYNKIFRISPSFEILLEKNIKTPTRINKWNMDFWRKLKFRNKIWEKMSQSMWRNEKFEKIWKSNKKNNNSKFDLIQKKFRYLPNLKFRTKIWKFHKKIRENLKVGKNSIDKKRKL